MADVTLTYKGSTIAEINATGTKTLKTSGKYCEGDIGVSYVKPSSGGSGFWDKNTASNLISRGIYSIDLPSDLTKIGNYAFADCGTLKLSSLPNSVTEIGRYAFYNCFYINLTYLPTSLTKIYPSAFEECHALKITSIPNGVTSIGERAFYGCDSITTIEIPVSVYSVGSEAFKGCSNLTEVTFKDILDTVGTSAFASCPKLTDIYVPWAQGAVSGAPWGATNATIHYNTTT